MDDAPGRARTTPYAWYVVGVLTLANVSANVDQQILGALVGPIKHDFGISDVQISSLTGLAFAVFYSVLGLPIARLADRSNRRNIMTAGVTLWSLFTALCATATTYARLFMMRIGVGVGEAALIPPSVSMIADYVPRERLGRAGRRRATTSFTLRHEIDGFERFFEAVVERAEVRPRGPARTRRS